MLPVMMTSNSDRTGIKYIKYRDHSILSAIYECLCLVLLSLCLDIVDFVVVLYLYFVELLLSFYDVFFFFFLLPVMVNKDEYITHVL